MTIVLGVNAVFHDPAAALVVDGEIVAAAEEERFSRRKHGKEAVPFSTWELPVEAARWCLTQAGLDPADVDAVAYSYDPSLVRRGSPHDPIADEWEGLRTLYAQRAPRFLATALPGLRDGIVRFVPHHLAHAASAALAVDDDGAAFLVLDGRGEATSSLAGRRRGTRLEVLAAQALPHSIGFVYEAMTAHLGFRRGNDECKVMALASYGEPVHLDRFRELVRVDDDGGFVVAPIDWASFAPAGRLGDERAVDERQANLASSVQHRLEEVELELAHWLHRRTGARVLAFAGGVALNCVANARLLAEGPFEDVWVQPAAGDAGTALGAALYTAAALHERLRPMTTAALGRGFSDAEIEQTLRHAHVTFERPSDLAAEVAEVLARDGIVGWFQGRSEFGPRALGQRSLLAHPGPAANLDRLNSLKGREEFRPVAPVTTIERAKDVFDRGPVPSPYMLFAHRVRPEWRDRVAAVVHVDGTSRVQTVDRDDNSLLHDVLGAFEERTDVPVLVNTSFNTAGRPIVDDPRDALECFGSAPIDALAIGPFLVRRPGSSAASGVSP